jgi:hypothetical protein
MTSQDAGPHREALAPLGRQADHRDVERALLAAGWTPCDAGDWAIALRSPGGAAGSRLAIARWNATASSSGTAATEPDLVVARIPEAERRFMTEIPLAASGPWQLEAREAMRAGLAAADARSAGG